ncbi:MAG: hypothetical protein K2L04_07975 [Alistipes sp.]|nr:hypothetical protein [Alistipes sp.]
MNLFVVCSVCSGAVVAGLLGLRGAEFVRSRRQQGFRSVLRRRYLHIVMAALAAGDRSVPRFPLLRRAGSRLVLAETLAGIVSMTCGLDIGLLRQVVAHYGLDRWLLRRVRFAQGYRRARYLALLAALPVGEEVPARVVRYGRSRNRYVRFFALMTRMAAEPAAAVRRMADHAVPFSDTEVAEIMTFLRRGALPVAYEPLVASPSFNLRRVGLSIVRQFGIEEAEPLLLRMVGCEGAPVLGAEALRTLCALRRPLVRPQVRRLVGRMSSAQRRSLMRCMVRNSYSPAALQSLFDEAECDYYRTVVRSYKRCLS